MSLEGRVAIITGGSRGIGRGIAVALARAGADVAFCYSKDDSGARETSSQLDAVRGRSLACRADVTDAGKVKEMVEQTVATFGGVDILVNNAGIAGNRLPLAEENVADMRRVLDTHIFGSVNFTQAVLPHMRRRPRGDICFISSVAAAAFRANSAAYTMAKISLEAMTRVLAKEEMKNNIRVNAIGPGVIESEMTLPIWRKWRGVNNMQELGSVMPFGRVGQPEDIGNLIAFMVSELGSWISGQVIYVDGGAKGYSLPVFLAQG